MSARALSLVVAALVLALGCEEERVTEDAALDAGAPDGGPVARDAGPRVMPRPPRPRPPDGGCPPPPDLGAAHLYELGASTMRVGDVIVTDDGGAWITVLAEGPRRVIALRVDRSGAPVIARSIELDAPSAPRAASFGEGGVVLAATSEDELVVIALAADGALAFARAIAATDGVYRDAPLVAADEAGVVVAASVRRGSSVPNAMHVAQLDASGAVRWERRLEGRRSAVYATALATSGPHLLVAARTDAFSSRVRTQAGELALATGPWLLAFDRGGALAWQRAFDVAVGEDLGLEVIVPRRGGWLLGGGTDTAGESPLLVDVTDEGVVRAVTVLDGVPNLRVRDLDEGSTSVRILMAGTDYLYASDAADAQRQLLDLDPRYGRTAYAPDAIRFAGRPPECDDALGTATNHPSLCGATRRDLMVLSLPRDQLSPCMRGLALEPFTAQERTQPLPVDTGARGEPIPFTSPTRALDPALEDVTITDNLLCMSSAECVRAFAAP